ncbi:MAG: diacylglycerol kinase family protein [Ignavibacteriaceae bacterium]
MKVILLLNKNSGRFKKERNCFTEKKIKDVFNWFNIETELIELNNIDISEILKPKLNSSIDAVVAVGGDGTVSTAAAILSSHEIPLAILPAGSLNHFAKDLNIPFEIEKVAEYLSAGKTSKVDAGEVNGKIFINNSSIGFYPKVVRKRMENQKPGSSKWTAMAEAVLNAFKNYPLLEVNLVSGNKKVHCETPFIFIGNNEYYMDILNLGKREKLNEGFLSIYYPNSNDKYSMFRFAFLALINKLNKPEDFTTMLTKELRLDIPRPSIEIALDGELHKFTPPLEYKILPGCLNVIVP